MKYWRESKKKRQSQACTAREKKYIINSYTDYMHIHLCQYHLSFNYNRFEKTHARISSFLIILLQCIETGLEKTRRWRLSWVKQNARRALLLINSMFTALIILVFIFYSSSCLDTTVHDTPRIHDTPNMHTLRVLGMRYDGYVVSPKSNLYIYSPLSLIFLSCLYVFPIHMCV